MRARLVFLLALALLACPLTAAEIHVATTGDDTQPGTADSPLRTIQRAAELAQPGDVITVHAGVYRERIDPPRGGSSDANRIVYQAAPGEAVAIKGSEPARDWQRVAGDTWKLVRPNSFFGTFNPYTDLIHGDWFNGKGRDHHTGAVYRDGQWLTEAATQDEVLKAAGDTPLWFAQVDAANTTIWAQFPGLDPTTGDVEINVRQTIFYPSRPGMNSITVRGFTMAHAATPWAPPTAQQIGLIGTHWSKGWVIENNRVSHSVCSGIALGKHGDEFDNTSADTAEGYVLTIERALKRGWNRDTIGHHVVRNNHISDCEQAGIVGSLGAAFSTVTGNTIHDIHVRRLFTGAEMAGIKFHAAIDTQIADNHIHHTVRGLWLDWMAQGTRVSRNVFHDNSEDLFVEVNHGPFLIDNNLFLSATSLRDWSQGGAYVHNLFAGTIASHPELARQTPYHPPHSTAVAGLLNIQGGDDRFYNNLFIGDGSTQQATAESDQPDQGFGLWVYDAREAPLHTGGNVYLNGSRPYRDEPDAVVVASQRPAAMALRGAGRPMTLDLELPPGAQNLAARIVSTERLGKARVAGLPYVNPDDSAITIDQDFQGVTRDPARPTAGPFEKLGEGANSIPLGTR